MKRHSITRTLTLVALAILIGIVSVSCGGSATPAPDTTTIPKISLTDYTTEQLTLLINDTYRQLEDSVGGGTPVYRDKVRYYELLIIIYQNELTAQEARRGER